MIGLLIVSCDKYSDLWEPFFYTLFKYWPDCPYKIYLASNYKLFEDERVTNISFGEDQDYSTNLINIVNQIEEDRIFYWFDDVFLLKKVNTEYVQNIINQAIEADLDHLKLSVDSPLYYGSNKEIFGPISKGVKYRAAIGMAVYKKEKLLQLLVPGQSAWELDKSTRADSLDINFNSLNSNLRFFRRPFFVVNSVIKGKWMLGMKIILKREGLSKYYGNRKRQKLSEFLYIVAYLIYMECFYSLKKHPKVN